MYGGLGIADYSLTALSHCRHGIDPGAHHASARPPADWTSALEDTLSHRSHRQEDLFPGTCKWRQSLIQIAFPRTCSSHNSGRPCLIGMGRHRHMRQNDETDLAYCEPLADCERRNGELCKLWRKQYLRLSITIKALRQAFTVCQRAWLADCEWRTEPVFAGAT